MSDGIAHAYGYDYDSIGNRLWSAENATTNTYTANCLNQYESVLRDSASPREMAFDVDGNMTNDGERHYVYDAENRLLSAYPQSPTNGSLAVVNNYDHRHRRIRKFVRRFDGSAWDTVATHTFVWDGNNIALEKIAFADGTTKTCEYFWGPDKSGTEQGAGGVGGLLAVSIDGVFYVPCYDHNGNVVVYVSESGATAAQYVYDPYGKVVEQSGDIAESLSFGFSTKYRDSETGMVSYQRRFYLPALGRWLNRDPIEEEGGENLYAFCRNSPAWNYDVKGCGVWRFGIPSPWGNVPEFSVSCELDENERKNCKGVKVLRYVRGFRGLKGVYGGQIGPYHLDGDPEQFVAGNSVGYAPDDWPEGPGIGWWNTVYYRIPWSWDFKFEAVCTKGCLSGKTLSTRQKLYWADGHKPGDDSFEHGFSDMPNWWPDLTLPTTFSIP